MNTDQQQQDDAVIQGHLAAARAKIRTAMIGRVDASVFTLDLVDLALEMCEGLLHDEVTGAVPLLMEQLHGHAGRRAGAGWRPGTTADAAGERGIRWMRRFCQ